MEQFFLYQWKEDSKRASVSIAGAAARVAADAILQLGQ